MTYKTLLEYDAELTKTENSVYNYFNRGKIKNFYAKYGGLLSVVKKKLNLLQQEFFVIENSKFKYEEKESKQVPVMKEGKTFEEYSIQELAMVSKEI